MDLSRGLEPDVIGRIDRPEPTRGRSQLIEIVRNTCARGAGEQMRLDRRTRLGRERAIDEFTEPGPNVAAIHGADSLKLGIRN